MGPPRQAVLPKFLYGAGRVGGLGEMGGASCWQPCPLESTNLEASNALHEVKATPLPQSSDSDCVLIDTKSTTVKVSLPHLELLDPLVASQLHVAARKRRRLYEGNRHFQDS
jgi:hypothetical protein